MICSYFWQGKVIKRCEAYPEGLMVPSIEEEKNYCTSSDYRFCPYYLKAEEKEELPRVGEKVCKC